MKPQRVKHIPSGEVFKLIEVFNDRTMCIEKGKDRKIVKCKGFRKC